MKKIRLLRARTIQQLRLDIGSNLERYRTGNFDFLEADPANYFESAQDYDDLKLAELTCEADNHREVECCMAIYAAMKGIPLYLARDSRIWVYLTHTVLLDYARKRWPIPDDDEKAAKHIQQHFFASGNRAIERDNAASRLWWMASLCDRVEGLTLEQSLSAFLYKYDVRANIIERPTTSQSIPVFSAVIHKLHKSLVEDDQKELFERDKFRNVMKQLNLRGGVKLLGSLSPETISGIVDSCAEA